MLGVDLMAGPPLLQFHWEVALYHVAHFEWLPKGKARRVSTAMDPGVVSVHSEKVLTGTWGSSSEPGIVVKSGTALLSRKAHSTS